jgi:uncharacterized membrane protein (DUF106 family)
MAFLDPVLSPLLQPLLDQSPFLAILLLAFVISLLITLVYKFFTNQGEMKRLKDEQKGFQARMKELRSNPEEMMKVQKDAMKVNMEYMKHSFKPTLITMLPIILIFGWMAAHLAFEPIFPGEPYSISAEFADGVTGQAELLVDGGTELSSAAKQDINSRVTWDLKSSAGNHILTVKGPTDQQAKKVLITKDFQYEEGVSLYQHSDIESITINYNKLKPLGQLSIFGWQPGWLGVYIILSLVFSIALRKLMKLH